LKKEIFEKEVFGKILWKDSKSAPELHSEKTERLLHNLLIVTDFGF